MEKQNEIYKMPHNEIVENYIIGKLISENSQYFIISELLKTEHFYNDTNKKLYSEIQRMNGDVHLIYMFEYCMKKSIPPYELTVRTSHDTLPDNFAIYDIKHFAMQIIEYHAKRNCILLAAELSHNAQQPNIDIFSVIDKTITSLKGASDIVPEKTIHILKDTIHEFEKDIEEKKNNAEFSIKVPTGFANIDHFNAGGWDVGDLVIIAGERSHGKTSFALSSMYWNAKRDKNMKMAIISMEMTRQQIRNRFISMETGIDVKLINALDFSSSEWDLYNASIDNIVDSTIYIIECSSEELAIQNKIYECVQKYSINWFFIDYMNIIKRNSRDLAVNEYGRISRNFKAIAKEENVHIWLGAQLNKNNDDPCPKLGRIRDGGQVEDNADVVAFIWQPSKYGQSYQFSGDYDPEHEATNTQGKAQLIQAKGRNTGTNSFILNFKAENTLFSEYKDNDDIFYNNTQPNNDF